MKRLREEYLSIMKDLDGDVPGREAALAYVADSDIWAYGAPAPFSYVPHLFGPDDVAFLRDVSSTTHGILTKIIARFLEDPSYREIFHFPAEVERLILLPCDYHELLPLARFDLFLDEADRSFKFCEFNTDGSGAMSRDLEVGHALQQGATYQEFARRHQVDQFELFDSWVRAFMKSYRETADAKDVPTIAVTDFRESGVFSDFNRFIAAFERAGMPARFVDVREFVFDGEHLVDPSDGTVIDAVYRRAVTSEILQHPGECDAFIDAIAAGKVCVIGHFRTTVVHSKVISIVLFDPRTRAFLTPEEGAFIDAHVPRTYRLKRDGSVDLETVLATKDEWIVKPEDDYGAHGVYLGLDMDDEAWRAAIENSLDKGFVVQEFYPPHRIDMLRPEVPEDGNTFKVQAWRTMPGLYVYNGELAGLYCRESLEGIIALDRGGVCTPSFKVDCA